MKVKVLSLLMMLAVVFVFAQDFPLRRSYKLDWQGYSIPTEDDHDLIFWGDSVAGNLDIYIQKVSQYGVNAWAVPLRIEAPAGTPQLLGAVRTTDNCYIIAWQVYHNPHNALYVQKINSSGQFVWPQSGIMLYQGDNKIIRPKLIANDVGGAFLVYAPNYDDYRIFGINMDIDGQNLWQAGGQLLIAGEGYLSLVNAVSDGTGGLILDCRVQSGEMDPQTHLARFDANGNQVGSDPLVPYTTFPRSIYTINACGDGNFLLVSNPEIEGIVVIWKINALGSQVGTAVNLNLNFLAQFRELKVATRPDGGFFVAWRGLEGEIYNTRVNSYSSAMQLEWGIENIPSFQTDENYYDLSIKAGSNDRLWLSYLSKIVCVNSSGVLNVNTGAIDYFGGYAQDPVISPRGDKASVFWKVQANAKTTIRKQVAYLGGSLTFEAGGAPLVEYLGGNAGSNHTVALGDRYLNIWMDYRNDGEIYYKLLDQNMQPWGEPNGSPLLPQSSNSLSIVDVQKINDSSVALLMIGYVDGLKALVQVIDQNGQPTIPGDGLVIKEGMSVFETTKMSVTDQNIYLGWIRDSDSGYQLIGQRIVLGALQWGAEGAVICQLPQNTFSYLTALAGNHYILTMEDYNANRQTARTIKVSPEGTIEPGFGPMGVELIPPTGTAYNQVCTKATFKDNFLYAYVYQPGYPQYRHFFQKIDWTGNREWGDQGVELFGMTDSDGMGDLVVDNTLSFVYRRETANENSLVYQSITLNGELLCLPNGLVVAQRRAPVENFRLISFSDESRALIWADLVDAPAFTQQHFDIFYRYLSPTGDLIGTIGVLCDAPYDQRYMSVSSLGTNALVTWSDDRAGVENEDYSYSSIYGRGIAMGSVATEDPEQPAVPRIALGQNYPNPFNPSTTISFSLPEASGVCLDIYNIRGQLVRSLFRDEAMPAGRSEVVWDGKDTSGTAVSSGIYLYKLRAGDQTLVRKMLLSK